MATRSNELIALSSLRSLTFYGLAIRGLGMSVLLVAASMSWYYCFAKRART